MRSAILVSLVVVGAAPGCCCAGLLGGSSAPPPLASSAPAFGKTGGPPVAPAAATPVAPAVPAAGGGFDIRLVRVQPNVHLNTEQLCDVGFTGQLAQVDTREARRYAFPAATRMSVKCVAATGEGWADLVFGPDNAAGALAVARGKRVRARVRATDNGYADYPIIEFVSVVGDAPPGTTQARFGALFAPVRPAFDFRMVQINNALVGTTQECAVDFAGDVDLVDADDLRRRDYPRGTQNRMSVKCKHAAGEEWVDLTFSAERALGALRVQRGSIVPVRVIRPGGGFASYPVLAYAGQ